MSSANLSTTNPSVFRSFLFSTGIWGLGICLVAGCGGDGNSATSVAPTANAEPAETQPTVAQTNEVPPTDVVSEFLDLVRRGGEDTGAERLLTKKAQSELRRIGRGVQPISSPDAKYQVTRSQLVPGDSNAALVHSIWTEPDAGGTTTEYQVVWAVQKETGGWRISGLAMELDPSVEPTVINFEDGDQLAMMLGDGETETQPTQAANDQATLSR